ncbi:prolyl oligopeptidase family serine peptidase [Gramella sp. GC03-9]|uniref:Prolyl oligopeptidase family serine peptidase n=1 Tax=Christiangramia oceanisediminis TaxID=2920386 RepID=A0A9X2I0B1_9FLAO|nr:prolyl oligopeptidase family serine peptidase [Gramella oceanisediminis]MCP9198581.1 prolyl oligopeptidase family serine peptidase [Gramella oceanisediminis]
MESTHRSFCAGILMLVIYTMHAQNPMQYIQTLIPDFPEHIMPEEAKGRVLGPGLFNHSLPITEAYHHGTKTYAGHTKEGELYLRKEGKEDIQIISRPAPGWRWEIADALWSPSGKMIVAKQVNDTQVPRIELTKTDTIMEWPYTRAGEPLPEIQYYVITPETGTIIPVKHNLKWPYIHPLSWNENGSEIRVVQANRLMKSLELLRVDPSTSDTNLWFTDSSEKYLIGLELLQGYTQRLREANFFHFLDNREQFIYLDEESGFQQLVLYDSLGNPVKQLTHYKQNGIVSRLVGVDSEAGQIYFIGKNDINEPYAEKLFKVSLDDDSIEEIAEGPYFPEIILKDSIWVWRNDMASFSKLEVYDRSGQKLKTYSEANMSPIKELGFNPEFIQLKAADEKTMIEAMLLKPKEFDPDKKYPVIEWIYAAAHTAAIERTALSPANIQMQGIANQGFIVVIIDGRGSPGRGAEFRDYSYGKFGQMELQDHIKALQQLAERYSYMDLDRLGISGHSWGGHYALRAVLEQPGFYKAAHLSAPAIDPANFRVSIEAYMGCLPEDCPEAYERSGLTPKLDKLQAPILIHHGTADDDVPIEESFELVKALEARNHTDFEFIEFKGMDHIIMRNPKWEQDMISFFKKELGEPME